MESSSLAEPLQILLCTAMFHISHFFFRIVRFHIKNLFRGFCFVFMQKCLSFIMISPSRKLFQYIESHRSILDIEKVEGAKRREGESAEFERRSNLTHHFQFQLWFAPASSAPITLPRKTTSPSSFSDRARSAADFFFEAERKFYTFMVNND